MRRRSDREFTIALCVSLVVHGGLMVLLVHEKIALLARQLMAPAIVDARKVTKPDEEKIDPPADEPPTTILQSAPPEILPEFVPPKPPPVQRPPLADQKNPRDINDENIEWGEKNAKGFAITSAPGKVNMEARKGIEDQAFASRDPEGPATEFPDEPSLSTVPPGENGDGRKPVHDPLAGQGTQANPEIVLGHPNSTAIPPPPLSARLLQASSDDPSPRPETSGQSLSQMPAAERRSAAEANAPIAERDGLANDEAFARSEQIMPIKTVDFIGIPSNRQMYPDVVQALTHPPGVKLSSPRLDPIESPVLPNIIGADLPASPSIQPATAALTIESRTIEEMARRLGEADPMNGPAIVDALTHPPGAITLGGGPAPLPELVLADHVGGPAERDAIAALEPDQPRLEEMAEQLQQGAETPATIARKEAAGMTANASGGIPGPPIAAADPAPDTGLESDPFAKIPGVDFHDGKVEARSGRQVKPIRPHLTEAGKRDLLAMQFPTVVFKVRIDKTGKVKDVSVIQSSGSEAIDMPIYRALWEWWFEPPKDKKGNPLEDVQMVAIHWG